MKRLSLHDRQRLIGERVRQYRLLRRDRQIDIADRIAKRHGPVISQKRLSFIERNKATNVGALELALIAEALHEPITKFLEP